MKSCILKLKDSEEHLISVYKSVYNNDHLQEQLKVLQEQVDTLNEELNLSQNVQTGGSACNKCFKKESIIKELAAELKSKESLCMTAQVELNQAKSLKDQAKIIQDKKLEELKTQTFAELSSKISSLESDFKEKHNEVTVLNDEIKQRDFLLEKAKSLVVSLNQELEKTRKEGNAKGMKSSSSEQVLKENEKLKNIVQNMEKTIDELHKKMGNEGLMNKSLVIDSNTFFSGSSLKNSIEERKAKKERLLEKEAVQTQKRINDTKLENEKLSKTIQELEDKCMNLQTDKDSLSENLAKSYESIGSYRKQIFELEEELKKNKGNKYTQNIEDLGKLLAQKENIIHEMTLQIAKSHKHKRHRHSIHLRDPAELLDMIKKEIAGESPDPENLKENGHLFKDFKSWYRNFLSDNKNLIEEIVKFLMENSAGTLKKNLKNYREKLSSQEPGLVVKQLLSFFKSAFVAKHEIMPGLKTLKKNLFFSIESIGLVVEKLEEIRKNLAVDINSEMTLKVIDMMLGFLRKFSKERENDYDLSIQVIKIINV